MRTWSKKMLRNKNTILKLTSSASLLSKIGDRLLCLLLSISNRKLEKALSSKWKIPLTFQLAWTTFLLLKIADMLIWFIYDLERQNQKILSSNQHNHSNDLKHKVTPLSHICCQFETKTPNLHSVHRLIYLGLNVQAPFPIT